MQNVSQPPIKAARKNDLLEHQLLSMWVESAHIGMVVIDDTARVVMLNSGACQKFGVDGSQALNMPLKMLLCETEGSLSLMQWLATLRF